MNDGQALAICVAQLGTPKVPRAQMAALLPGVAWRVRAAAQERGEREPDKGHAVGMCAMSSKFLQHTSVDQSSCAWMATCLPALSTRLSSAHRAFARAF